MKTPLTPLDFMRRARRLYGDREAVVDGDLRLTYARFFERCDRWSARLLELGVRPGDRVAIIAPNTHAMLEAFYAVPQIGAVLVPVNYRLAGDDFTYILGHSGASVVCVHGDYLELVDNLRETLPNVRHFVALEGGAGRSGWLDYEAEIARGDGIAARPIGDIDEDAMITINYTSGTTARPKGVVMTHRNTWANSIGTLVHVPMTPADRYLWTLPMFHANGWTFTWTVTAAGGTHVCLRKVEAAAIMALVARERVTLMSAAPTILIGLANAPAASRGDLPRGVRVTTAGAAPAAATIERIETELGWEVRHVYGLTETAPFILVNEQWPEHASLEAAERYRIKARQGVELVTSGELLVVDDDDVEVPRDGTSIGEIAVRGNVVMKGYYDDPEATAKALRGGFFHTGDAAVVHPDGFVEIRDRIKDVIISGGENISSIEVEGVLLRHDAVAEVAVVGMPDDKWGEAPHAFVVCRPGATAEPEELRLFTRERLAHFKVPKAVHFVDELPKTATGKIQKFVLRGRATAVAAQ